MGAILVQTTTMGEGFLAVMGVSQKQLHHWKALLSMVDATHKKLPLWNSAWATDSSAEASCIPRSIPSHRIALCLYKLWEGPDLITS